MFLFISLACLAIACQKKIDPSQKAMSLIDSLTDAWRESSMSFSNQAHLACVAIKAVDDVEDRLKCALACHKTILSLPIYMRECDEDGFWTRQNAHAAIKQIVADIDIECKWHITLKWWRSMREEQEHYDAYGTAKPMRLTGGIISPSTTEDAENNSRRVALTRRHYANYLKGCIRARCRPIFEYALKEDWQKIPNEHKATLMEKVYRELGRYPKWYRAGKDEAEKDIQPQHGGLLE